MNFLLWMAWKANLLAVVFFPAFDYSFLHGETIQPTCYALGCFACDHLHTVDLACLIRNDDKKSAMIRLDWLIIQADLCWILLYVMTTFTVGSDLGKDNGIFVLFRRQISVCIWQLHSWFLFNGPCWAICWKWIKYSWIFSLEKINLLWKQTLVVFYLCRYNNET